MARFLVSLAYGGKKYATLITALDSKNAIDFSATKCLDVASKATGKSYADIIKELDGNLPFEAEIVH